MRLEKRFGLYLILTEPRSGYLRCAEAAVAAGVRCLQLRMKNAPREQVLCTAAQIRAITTGTRTLFIMNDDPMLAQQAGADGVHLGQEDGAASAAFSGLCGRSTHSMEQARRAAADGADYIGIGPVYATATKSDHEAVLGPEEAGRIAQAVQIPAVAIGGITVETLPAVLAAGFDNFCVVSAVNAAPAPEEPIARLMELWLNSG